MARPKAIRMPKTRSTARRAKEIATLHNQGLKAQEIADELEIGIATVYVWIPAGVELLRREARNAPVNH